jgi:hypothetical protein
VPEGEAVSITELEYETARSRGLPRLLFVADDSFTPVFIRESEAAYTRQEQLRARILAEETVDRFGNDAEKLAARVAAALTNEIARHRAGPQPSRPAALWPEKPEGFVERPAEYKALKAALLGHAVGITTALKGAGGFGKTTLARALCADPEIQAALPNGLLWTTLGETPGDLAARTDYLVEQLAGQPPASASLSDAADRLRRALGSRRMLIVIDDVWNAAHLRPFLEGGPACARLVTTRDAATLPDRAAEIRVDAMRSDEARALLAQGTAGRVGEWPLLLRLVNGVVKDEIALGATPEAALAYADGLLAEVGLTAFDIEGAEDRHDAVAKTLDVSIGRLPGPEAARLRELAVFPEDVDVPIATVRLHWQHTGGLGALATDRLLRRLFALSFLLTLDLPAQRIRLHDVIRTYLRQQREPHLSDLDRNLVEAYRRHCPAGWPSGPADGYFHAWLPTHLRSADHEAWRALLADVDWLAPKLRQSGVSALLADYADVPDPDLRLIGDALRLSAHVIGRNPDQLAGQLAGRLGAILGAASPLLRQVLAPSGEPRLLPRWPTLTSPGAALRQTLEGHGGWVSAVAVTPDGRRAVSGSAIGTLKLWDLERGAELATLEGHGGYVNAVAVTPDERRAVSGSDDRTLKVWDLERGTVLATFTADHAITAVAAVSDRLFLTGDGGGRVHLLELVLAADRQAGDYCP